MYVDASALVKLVFDEEHSAAMRTWIADRNDRISSVISRVEVRRTAQRIRAAGLDPAAEDRAADMLARVTVLGVSDGIVERASTAGPPTLRSLDAIHLATAMLAGAIDAFVTYDDRLAQAARAAGLRVVQPGRGAEAAEKSGRSDGGARP